MKKNSKIDRLSKSIYGTWIGEIEKIANFVGIFAVF